MFKIGIDEAGRGPWAGPVFAGIVILSPEQEEFLVAEGITDSKKLTRKKRESLFKLILKNSLFAKVKFHTVERIDSVGVYKATKDLINELVEDLMFREYIEKSKHESTKILIDGVFPVLKLRFEHECIIKGDAKEPAISAASILAKVRRDDYMKKIHELFPQYGFAKHKGYGTKLHQEKLAEFGPCEEHRKSFKPVRLLIKN